MPILPAEPSLYPEGLFEQSSERNPARRWWVLHTRPRQEKSLARQLVACQTPFYLPIVATRVRMRNRTMTSYLPLFPGYLFLLAEAEEHATILGSKRIARSIPVVDQEKLWLDLGQLHRLISAGGSITPEDRLVPGVLVEIRSGPLMGLRGKILKSATGQRFLVEVDFIQKGASILVDDFTLVPVSE